MKYIFRHRLAALFLVLAGIFFVLYPATRPFSDETSMEGAAAFASSAWVLSHSLAMVGFILLMLAWFVLYLRLQGTTVERLAFLSLVLSWIGIGLTLPYYGAETFGLHAIGQAAVQRNDASLLSQANSVRFEEGVLFFGPGLILLGVGPILFAAAIWRSGSLPKWSGIPLAVALALFIPQFYTPQIVRVLHGVLVAIGCFVLAWSITRGNKAPQGRPEGQS